MLMHPIATSSRWESVRITDLYGTAFVVAFWGQVVLDIYGFVILYRMCDHRFPGP